MQWQLPCRQSRPTDWRLTQSFSTPVDRVPLVPYDSEHASVLTLPK